MPSINPADVIAEARRWIGTPFHHQGRQLGVGVDCAGLIVCVATALGMSARDMSGYGREPNGGMLKRALDEQLLRVTAPGPGDVLLMRFSREPQHLAFRSVDNIIHAYQSVGRCVEHSYDVAWRKRAVAAYRFREVQAWLDSH